MKNRSCLLAFFALFSIALAATTDDCHESIYAKLAPLATVSSVRDFCYSKFPKIPRTFTRLTGRPSTVTSITGKGRMVTVTSTVSTPTTTRTTFITTGEGVGNTRISISTPTRTVSHFTGVAETLTVTVCPNVRKTQLDIDEAATPITKPPRTESAPPSTFETVLVARADTAGEEELIQSFFELPAFILNPACSCLLDYGLDPVSLFWGILHFALVKVTRLADLSDLGRLEPISATDTRKTFFRWPTSRL